MYQLLMSGGTCSFLSSFEQTFIILVSMASQVSQAAFRVLAGPCSHLRLHLGIALSTNSWQGSFL